MAVHLIFCRIIAEVVRPLPPLVALSPATPLVRQPPVGPLAPPSVASTKGAALSA